VPIGVPPQLASPIQQATHTDFIMSFNDTIRFTTVLLVVAVVITVVFVRRRDTELAAGVQPHVAAVQPTPASAD
jgi:hypothetical protein